MRKYLRVCLTCGDVINDESLKCSKCLKKEKGDEITKETRQRNEAK